MKEFLNYVKSLRQAWAGYINKSTALNPVYFILGNTSCDMDSVVGSIALGFFMTQEKQMLAFPLINCKREAFQFKLDIIHNLAAHNITAEDLLYFDEVKFSSLDKTFKIVLVDHNQLDVEQEFVQPSVIGIIDHHADSDVIQNLSFRVVEKSGSACTLIYERYLWVINDNKNLVDNFGKFLLAPLYLDSFHFNPSLYNVKYYDRDLNMVSLIKKLSDNPISEEYFLELQSLKQKSFNLKFLGIQNALELDFKRYQVDSCRLGISVLIMPFNDMVSLYGLQKVKEDFHSFALKKNLSLLLVIFYNESMGTFYKELVLNNFSFDSFNEFRQLIESSDLKLEIRQAEKESNFFHYNMANIKYTRKSLEPLVKELIVKSISSLPQ